MQVIEFSWVFAFAAVLITLLLYLTFLLFFYVYAFHVTQLAADELLQSVGSPEEPSSYFSGPAVPAGSRATVERDLHDRMRRMTFLPGMTEVTRCETTGKILVKTEYRYFGKEMFCVKAERELIKPTDYAKWVDLLGQFAGSPLSDPAKRALSKQ